MRAFLRAFFVFLTKSSLIVEIGQHLPEKRRALDAWALRLLEIVGDEPRADNVVPIVR